MKRIVMTLAFMLISKSILDAHVTVRPGGTYTVDSYGATKADSRPYPGELREKRKGVSFHVAKNKKRKKEG